MVIVLIIVIGIIILLIKHHTKVIKYNNVCLITGAIKSGKTALAVHLSIKEHKRALLKWRIQRFFGKKVELPLLYSNVPLKYKYYIPLTTDELMRKKRLAYNSIVLFSEASLIADSQSYIDKEVSENITLFAKLFAHETKGGKLFIETQSISDLHYALKRVLNNYIYIHHTNTLIPFFMRYKVREMLYSYDDSNIHNDINEDIEESLKTMWVCKRVWKLYDRYTYSSFTDDLDYNCVVLTQQQVDKLNLKSTDIVSFNKYKFLKRSCDLNEKKN